MRPKKLIGGMVQSAMGQRFLNIPATKPNPCQPNCRPLRPSHKPHGDLFTGTLFTGTPVHLCTGTRKLFTRTQKTMEGKTVLILRSPPYPGRWRTVQFALDSWSRTARLCLIYLTMNAPVGVLAMMIKR